MRRLLGSARAYRVRAAFVLAFFGLFAYALSASAAPAVPVPNPIVWVTTTSGDVTKSFPVPIGGAPVPIDVDDAKITGLLNPDIDVSVGLVALDELPGKPIVPNVVVKRSLVAQTLGLPAPPVELDAKIELKDAANGLADFAEIHYGFKTPPNAVMPPIVSAKLVGPIEGAFIDPLQAKLESPGYGGPLDFKVSVKTAEADNRFDLAFDSLPESVFLDYRPLEHDGLDATYKHNAAVADVHLKAKAMLKNLEKGTQTEIGAEVERLPQELHVVKTGDGEGHTGIAYDSSSALSKPDIRASIRDTKADGSLALDAEVKLTALPHHLRGAIDTILVDGKPETGAVKFAVTDAEGNPAPDDQIDAVEFVARNYTGSSDVVPVHDANTGQYVTFASRHLDATHSRWRASGRVLGVRSLAYVRTDDPDNQDPEDPGNDKNDYEIIDADLDLGDGTRPLRAIVDTDSRHQGADPEQAGRTFLDTTLTPLPKKIHTTFDPSNGQADPTHITYDSNQGLDVTARAEIAKNQPKPDEIPSSDLDGCGKREVTCLDARIDKVPTHLDLTLPGLTGTDFEVSHNGQAPKRPDVRAVIDRTGDKTTERTWAKVDLTQLPQQMRGRVAQSEGGALTAAEFHACDWDYADAECDDAQGEIGRVAFTVRDQPSRVGLPDRPATGPQFVAMLGRDDTLEETGDERFEASGVVEAIQHVAFRQRDLEDDGKGDGEADGTLGVDIRRGQAGSPFDVVVDTTGRAADPEDLTKDIGPTATKLDAHVEALPAKFGACLRSFAAEPPTTKDDLPADALLEECDRYDQLELPEGKTKPDVTPLSLEYHADTPMTVDAELQSEAPDPEDTDNGTVPPRPHTTVLETHVPVVPGRLRADVIPGQIADDNVVPKKPGRRLEVSFRASTPSGEPKNVDAIDIRRLETRRSTSVCADPRPNRSATCVKGEITDLPSEMYLGFDPDVAKGDIEFRSVSADDSRASIDGLELSTVSPASQTPMRMTGAIHGLTPRLAGRIVQRDLDPSTPTLETAALELDACTDEDGEFRCDGSDPHWGYGIGTVEFDATNALVGKSVAIEGDIPAGADHVAFVTRGERFTAKGKIAAVREVAMSRLDPETGATMPSTRVRLGYGQPGSELRAFLDMLDNKGRKLADILIDKPPRVFEFCMRDPVADPSQVRDEAPTWCETAKADRSALQMKVKHPQGGAPDVDVRRLMLTNADGSEFLTGRVKVHKLASEVDILPLRKPRETGGGAQSCSDNTDDDGDGKVDGEDPDCKDSGANLEVTARDADGNVAAIADRIDVTLQTFKPATMYGFGPPQSVAGIFPWKPLDGGKEPEKDPRTIGSDGEHNYLRAVVDGEKDFLVDASIPKPKKFVARPGPCVENPDVLPAVTEFPGDRVPDYRCFGVTAGGGEPLGLAVRMLDGQGLVTDVEQGLVTQMPSGEDGFRATIANASPAGQAAEDPWCDKTHTMPCRPPVISIDNDRGAGQSADDTTLKARVSTGRLNAITEAKETKPRDDDSDQLDFNEAPGGWTYEEKGARIKQVTTEDGEAGMYAGVNIALPRYFDFYPPVTWSCKATDPSATEPDECDENGVSSNDNRGYESQDIGLKVVGADDKHDGAGVDWLGRFSVLIDTHGSPQTILTGAPDPDHKDTFGTTTEGASSHTPETLRPDTDPAIWGARMPGHLDVRVTMRHDYTAEQDTYSDALGDGADQVHYTQIDGRVNRPLSINLHVNDKFVDTRSGHKVSGVTLSAINLPSSNGEDDFAKPTFRIRAELRPSFNGNTKLGDVVEKVYTDSGLEDVKNVLGVVLDLIDFIETSSTSGFSYFSPVLPTNLEAGWIDIKLNADPKAINGSDGHPYVTSDGAARTVDVVGGPFGMINQADIRGWDRVLDRDDAPVGPMGKGFPAELTPQFDMRLYGAELGLEGGATLFGLVSLGVSLSEVIDTRIGLVGQAVKRARILQALTALELAKGEPGDEGKLRIGSKTFSEGSFKIVFKAWFGAIEEVLLDQRFGNFEHPLEFRACSGFQNLGDSFTNSIGGVALTLGAPDVPLDAGADDHAAAAIGQLTRVVSTVLGPISCLIHFGFDVNSPLVTPGAPAPRYEVGGRPTEHLPLEKTPEPLPDMGTPKAPKPPTEINIDGSPQWEYMCGNWQADTIRFLDSAKVKVGPPGMADPRPVKPGEPTPPECDGSLAINAENVHVLPGAEIRADGLSTAAGLGAGQWSGGGGHGGAGGPSSRENDGGLSLPDPGFSVTEKPFGGRGGGGSNSEEDKRVGDGGFGGGAISISAVENATIEGLVTANGGDGHPSAVLDYCPSPAAGGGAGGTVAISALRVVGGGKAQANGGRGGDGGDPGGGGGGGNVLLTSVIGPHVTREAEGGQPGELKAADPCEHEASEGEPGPDDLGLVSERMAFVSLNEATPGPLQTEKTIKLDLRAIQDQDEGPDVNINVCEMYAPPDDPAGAQSPLLSVPEDAADLDEAMDAAHRCWFEEFSAPNHGNDEYHKTIDVNVWDNGHDGEGWYSYFAFARQCDSSGCYDQGQIPKQGTAVIGIDRSAPKITSSAPYEASGDVDAGCWGARRCVRNQEVDILAKVEDPIARLQNTRCRVNDGDWTDTCGKDSLHVVDLGDGEGIKDVDMQMSDTLGNVGVNRTKDAPGTVDHVARFFVDTKRPEKPQAFLNYDGPAKNGWYKEAPTLGVGVQDPNPSSGFRADAVTVSVDGVAKTCGSAEDGDPDGGGFSVTTCSPGEVEMPADGRSEVEIVASDRTGNFSETATGIEVLVDGSAPDSTMSLFPATPDGENGWYKSRPLMTFAADDGPFGSGVDQTKEGSGFTYRFDNQGDWLPWDALAEEGVRVPEGVHTVCWKATDVAGNESTPKCYGPTIKVDATAPTTADGLWPDMPDGENSFFVNKPTIEPTGFDPVAEGPGVNDQRSNVHVVRQQVDGGPWQDATQKTKLGDGVHEVRVQAFDNAGNASPVATRSVRVDTSNPGASLRAFPPAPNDQGWFRSAREVAVDVSDGVDGSGPDGAKVSVDGLPPVSYLAPFTLGDGAARSVTVVPRDRAGRTGANVSSTSKIDQVAPTAAPTGTTGSVILSALNGKKADLGFTASDALTPRVRVKVKVFDTLGNLVRTLDAPGAYTGGWRDGGAGSVQWDGKRENGTGVLPGLYHYRVHAVDQAGNTVMSTESKQFLVILGLLPL